MDDVREAIRELVSNHALDYPASREECAASGCYICSHRAIVDVLNRHAPPRHGEAGPHVGWFLACLGAAALGVAVAIAWLS